MMGGNKWIAYHTSFLSSNFAMSTKDGGAPSTVIRLAISCQGRRVPGTHLPSRAALRLSFTDHLMPHHLTFMFVALCRAVFV